MTKILDCTLRDGGYYTNWDFDTPTVQSYIHAINRLPIDYVEIGYRNKPGKTYLGKFGYCPSSVVQAIRRDCRKKIAVMLNEKDVRPEDLDELLLPVAGDVDMIRLAVSPNNFDRAVTLARSVKAMGFEVGFNCMYMSKWTAEYTGFISKLGALDGICDLFCMVDSFGGITPDEIKHIYADVRKYTSVPVGFHGHNNLQLGLINTLTAIALGIDYVDTTILGMGRGAGNLNTELLLTYLNAHEGLDIDFNVLGNVISSFMPLFEHYRWGTNLPYMIAGANGIPQKEVMEWVTNRIYSFNSIVRALQNKKLNKEDNAKFPEYTDPAKFSRVIVVAGGEMVKTHIEGIKEFIRQEPGSALIFVTARHAALFEDVKCAKFYTLVGTECKRMKENVNHDSFDDTVILPPYPRAMGTDVPDFTLERTYELPRIDFIDGFSDSSTAIALQLAINISDGRIFSVGYDGYRGNILSEKEMTLTRENRDLFTAFEKATGSKLCSLTPSIFRELHVESLYQFI